MCYDCWNVSTHKRFVVNEAILVRRGAFQFILVLVRIDTFAYPIELPARRTVRSFGTMELADFTYTYTYVLGAKIDDLMSTCK